VAIITGKGIIEGRGVLERDPAFWVLRAFDAFEGGRTVLWQDGSGESTPVTAENDPVGAWRDPRNGWLLATQSDADLKPRWLGPGRGIRFDRVDDVLEFDLPGPFHGYLVVGTGTASYALRVSIPAGPYSYGRWERFDLLALEFYELAWGLPYANASLARMVRRGAAPTDGFEGVTNLNDAWRDRTEIVGFPSVRFTGMATGTVDSTTEGFRDAWRGCSNLADFPANVFDGCASINFSGAFVDCALTEQSVDNILVSIESNGTSNGRIDINGGTNQAPGTAGRAAQAALQSRGWIVNVSITITGQVAAAATSSIVADGNQVAQVVPFADDVIAFLDAFKLLSDGFRTNDPVEVWPDAFGDPNAAATQPTVASRAAFQSNVESTGIPGLFFDGTADYYTLGDTWKLPKQGPWTLYAALRRNSAVSLAQITWATLNAPNATVYALYLISTARSLYTANGITTNIVPVHVGIADDYYFMSNNTRRVFTITKRENGGYSSHINNLMLFQTQADGTVTTPTVSPLLGARINAAGTAIDNFATSTFHSILVYNGAHTKEQRDAVNQFLASRYAITPPTVENPNTSILEVMGANARGHWINADTGSTAIDLSDYGRNGTYQNAPNTAAAALARFGNATTFLAASNQYVSNVGAVGDYNFMRSNHVWSFGAWIRPTNITTNGNYVLMTTASNNNVLGVKVYLFLQNEAPITRSLRVDLTGPMGQQQFNIPSYHDVWQNNRTSFITVVSNGTNIRMYVNGVGWSPITTITAATSAMDHDQSLSIAGPAYVDNQFNGDMQLAFVSNRALTQPEVIDMYASTRVDFNDD